MSSNRIEIILYMYQGYNANSDTFLWWGRMTTKQFTKTYTNTIGVLHCHIAMGIFVHSLLNWTPWHLVPWSLRAQLSESERQSDCESWSTSPLFVLFTCCWMSFEAVLGNKEFEFVVSEVTLVVVTRHSVSRHGVSVHLIPLSKNSLKKSKISSGNSCNYCLNNVQTLRLSVYKQKLRE